MFQNGKNYSSTLIFTVNGEYYYVYISLSKSAAVTPIVSFDLSTSTVNNSGSGTFSVNVTTTYADMYYVSLVNSAGNKVDIYDVNTGTVQNREYYAADHGMSTLYTTTATSWGFVSPITIPAGTPTGNYAIHVTAVNGSAENSVSKVLTIGSQSAPQGNHPKDDNRMSSEYKAGPFYTSLMQVNLSGNYAKDIAAVAISQIGYLESDSLSGTGTHNEDNHVEYNSFYGTDKVSWCAYFVCWCSGRAKIPLTVIKLSGYANPFELCPNATEIAFMLSKKEILDATTIENKEEKLNQENVKYYNSNRAGFIPKEGDLIFFHKGDKSAMWGHVGIVTGRSGNYVYFVDGNNNNNGSPKDGSVNVSGKVYEREIDYTREDSNVIGFARPNY